MKIGVLGMFYGCADELLRVMEPWVALKNEGDDLVLDTIRWDDGFTPPRIFHTDRHGGLRAFVWENELEYNDGTAANDLVPGIIPRNVAYVDHHTWGLKNIENKVRYQHRHFGFCPYRFDPLTKTASFDPAYFARWGLTMPVVKDGKAKTPRESLHVILRTHSDCNFREGARRLSDDLGGRLEPSLSLILLSSSSW